MCASVVSASQPTTTGCLGSISRGTPSGERQSVPPSQHRPQCAVLVGQFPISAGHPCWVPCCSHGLDDRPRVPPCHGEHSTAAASRRRRGLSPGRICGRPTQRLHGGRRYLHAGAGWLLPPVGYGSGGWGVHAVVAAASPAAVGTVASASLAQPAASFRLTCQLVG